MNADNYGNFLAAFSMQSMRHHRSINSVNSSFLHKETKTAVQDAELLNHGQTEERKMAKAPLLGSLYEKYIISKIKENSENISYH